MKFNETLRALMPTASIESRSLLKCRNAAGARSEDTAAWRICRSIRLSLPSYVNHKRRLLRAAPVPLMYRALRSASSKEPGRDLQMKPAICFALD